MNNNRFRMFGNYKVSKKLFRVYLMLVLIFGVVAAFQYSLSSEHYYISCDGYRPCLNPYYDNCPKQLLGTGICEQELLSPGFVSGQQPGVFYANFTTISSFLFVAFLLINHYKYNRGVAD